MVTNQAGIQTAGPVDCGDIQKDVRTAKPVFILVRITLPH